MDLSPVLLQRVAPPIARCNHVAIKRASGKLTGSYVIDPELEIPIEMLAPLGESEERKNLLVDVGYNEIDIDVWVAQRTTIDGVPIAALGDVKHPRTTIDVAGSNIALRLHSAGERPFALSVKADSSGSVNLELPRNFRGPLTIRSEKGNVKFSPAFEPLVATFSDYDDIRKCFVGDFKELQFGQGPWEGSMIEITAPYGKLNLRFTDEPAPPKSPGKIVWSFGIGFKSGN
ncbi:hypothetical protein EXIGLDRAFT_424708 [Exidia glandulosa HHB12029]|uniref:DUF7330 domain-containing protein n=1 Tax=Exidia glandulosa HHB12029 TaxID=1314781 RepID=A0A165KKN3_EXIGL|nr:hypothetical protein EXIGLDRAFT_424708 [Exidia glandulosa HHB12029]